VKPRAEARRRTGTAHGSDPTDEALVRAALAGDRAAFEQLVRRHQRPLVNHLYRQIGHRDGSLDLAQEVFLKVYLSLESFDPRYRFTTWLYRIASNCAIDHLRKKKPVTCTLAADATDPVEQSSDRLQARGAQPTPHDVLRYRELLHRVELAISNLPPSFRQLLLLRHRQHCRYDEIARITELPIGTVKNRIFRAREILRRDLADLLETDAS
jgi:RNA polymerase sigma-70 factor (ECF subfamily)